MSQLRISVHQDDAERARQIIESHRTETSNGRVVRLRDEFETLQQATSDLEAQGLLVGNVANYRADGVVDAVTYPAALLPEHLRNLLAGKPSGLPTLQAPVGVHAGELPDGDKHTSLFQIVIRPTTGGGTAMFVGGAGGGPLGREVGKSFIGYTVRDMLPLAYESSQDRIIVKGELPDGKYDLVAKIPETDEKRLGLRIQQAVESTFGLTSRREARDVDEYVATVSQPHATGLTPSTKVNSGSMSFNPNTGRLTGANMPIARIMGALERGLARPVQDDTKLDGRFDVDLTWDPTSNHDAKVRAVKDQLGLTLTPAKRRLELVVIEAPPVPAAIRTTQPAH